MKRGAAHRKLGATIVLALLTSPAFNGLVTADPLDPILPVEGLLDTIQGDVNHLQEFLPSSVLEQPIPDSNPPQPPRIPFDPIPGAGQEGAQTSLILHWSGGDPNGDPITYNVTLGTSPDPQTVKCLTELTSCTITGLAYSTWYYWRVKVTDGFQIIEGPTWSFKTKNPDSFDPPIPDKDICPQCPPPPPNNAQPGSAGDGTQSQQPTTGNDSLAKPGDPPLTRPPPTEVRFENQDGTSRRPIAVTVERVPGTKTLAIRVQDANPTPLFLLISRTYVSSLISDPAFNYEYAETPDGDWYRILLGGATEEKKVIIEPFKPSGIPVFTRGSESSLLLAQRPMWIGVERWPHIESMPGLVTDANGTRPVNRTWFDPRLIINFDDADHAGQEVTYNRNWLARLGLKIPEFYHESGTQLPAIETEDAFHVHPPHFSRLTADQATKALYHFSEGVGLSVGDVILPGNNGEFQGGSSWATDNEGDVGSRSGMFTGTNYVRIAHGTEYMDLTMGPTGQEGRPCDGTVEASIFLDAAPTPGTIFSIIDRQLEWNLYVDSNRRLVFAEGPVGSAAPMSMTSQSVLAIGVWNSVSFSYDGTFWQMRINGVKDPPLASWNCPDGSDDRLTALGAYADGSGGKLLGRLDEIRISTLNRFPLDDAKGGSYRFSNSLWADDDSGNQNPGTYQGTIWTANGRTGGGIGPGFSLTNWLALPSPTMNPLHNGTVEAWVKLGSQPANRIGYQILDYHGYDTGIHFAVARDGGRWALNARIGDGAQNYYSQCTIQLSTWVHLAVTWDGMNVRLYVNGRLDSTFPSFKWVKGGTGLETIYVGRSSLNDDSWSVTGTIDDLVITPYAKTSFSVSSGCTSGNVPPFVPSVPLPVNGASLVSRYATLSWTGGDPNGDTVTNAVYLGTTNPPTNLACSTQYSHCATSNLGASTTYYWRVNASDASSTQAGPVWSFGTRSNQGPSAPSNVAPANLATDVPRVLNASWAPSTDADGDPITYTTFLGTTNPPTSVKCVSSASPCNLGTLASATTYYWNVQASDGLVTSTSPVWSFTTNANSAPSACFTVSPVTGPTTTVFTANASCTTDDFTPASSIQVCWDWDTDGWCNTQYSASKTYTFQFPTSGNKTIRMNAADSDWVNNWTTRTLLVNNPPTPCFTVTPTSGSVLTLFTVDATCSTDDVTPGPNLRISWDWENDGYDIINTTDKLSTHSYVTWGNKTIRMRVIDDYGVTSTTTRIVNVINSPPVLQAASLTPDAGTEYTQFTFSVVYSDLENGTPQYMNLRLDGQDFPMSAFEPSDTTYHNGKRYTYTTSLAVGSHTYFFRTADNGGINVSTPTFTGPAVRPINILVHDTESGTTGWTATGLWHLASNTTSAYAKPFSGSSSWWFGRDDSGTYTGGVGGTLTSPSIDLRTSQAPIVLSYMSWYETENNRSAPDIKKLEISVDGGSWVSNATWQVYGDADYRRWHARVIDLSDYVGHVIQIRFNFQPSGTNDDHRGWYIDNIGVGIDSDLDQLSDYLENSVVFTLTSRSAYRPLIEDGKTARIQLAGLDRYNVVKAYAVVNIIHQNWADLTIRIRNGEGTTCWFPTYDEHGNGLLVADLLTCVSPSTFQTHQNWTLEITDSASGATGRVNAFWLNVTGQLDRFDPDSDGDLARDGSEVIGRTSSPLTRDIDDDNLLDGFDIRPWVEDVYPTVSEVEGYAGDLRNGTQFRLSDFAGINDTSVRVIAHLPGADVGFIPTYDSTSDRWRQLFPTGTTGFSIVAEDVNRNRLTLRANLTVYAGEIQNGIHELRFAAGAAMAAKDAGTTLAMGAVAFPVKSQLSIGVVVAGAALFAGGMILSTIVDTVDDTQTVTRTELDWTGNNVANLHEFWFNGDRYGLDEGNDQTGWKRIYREHGEVWPTWESFRDYLANHPVGDTTVVTIDENTAEIVLRDVGRVVTALVIGGKIVDADIFQVEIDIWTQPAFSPAIFLKLYMQMMEASIGHGYWTDYPPPLHFDEEDEAKMPWIIMSTNGKDHSQPLGRELEGTIGRQFTAELIAAGRIADLFAVGVAEAGISFYALGKVQQQKKDQNLETVADWYWGTPSSPGCPETTTKRRCDTLDSLDDAVPGIWPDYSRSIFGWDATNKQDAVAIRSFLLMDPANPSSFASIDEVLSQAEDGFADLTGQYSAKIPIGMVVSMSDANIAFEYAESQADFKY
ncbi:MAG: hypothetical protein HY556_02820 [Euryarchaeota archaeon]|nr:hypothetical protein [Euryarchaeota archaeon]